MHFLKYSRLTLSLAGLSMMTFIAFAETDSAQVSLKPILDNLQSYKADFVQIIEDAEGQILQQTQGAMSLQKPNQLRWEVSLPDESLFVADGTVIYNLDPFVEQVTLLDQADIVNNNPLMLLISDDVTAWDNVEISLRDGEYVIQSNDVNANITTLTLRFDGGVLHSLISTDRQQQSNIITFDNIQQNISIPASAFRVELPPSYVIDDQRKVAAQR